MKTQPELMMPAPPVEAQIQRLRSQLEAVNQELEAFRYSVSHDLRAPLRHILGYADILLTGNGQTLDQTTRRHLQTIARSAEQMMQMFEALLKLSRMTRADMHSERVSLGPLVENLRKELQSEIKGRAIEWQIDDLPDVHGNPALLRQAIGHLLGNAIKFTCPRPQARIEVGAQDAGGETIFFVRDNGVGFGMDSATKLFGVFQRFHPESEFEGSGVGLATVRRIIHQHGGRTWAEGKVDGGATFYFSIPNVPEPAL